MSALFKKLNLKDQENLLILNQPEGFNQQLSEIQKEVRIFKDPDEAGKIEFALVFVTRQSQIEEFIKKIHPLLVDDALLWFSYPKKSSKKYKCDFNRDTGWESLGEFNLEPVRQVSVDEDWSALRFRDAGKIKKITRRESFAISREGKQRTTKKGK